MTRDKSHFQFIGRLAQDVGLAIEQDFGGVGMGWFALRDAEGVLMAASDNLDAIEFFIHGFRTGINLCQKPEAINDQRRTEEERG